MNYKTNAHSYRLPLYLHPPYICRLVPQRTYLLSMSVPSSTCSILCSANTISYRPRRFLDYDHRVYFTEAVNRLWAQKRWVSKFKTFSHWSNTMASTSFSLRDVGHITKFNGTNFSLWKFNINIVFKQYNLLDIVLGTSEQPESLTSGDVSLKNNYWNKSDNTAQFYIVSTIEDQCQRTLIACKTSWNVEETVLSAWANFAQNIHSLQMKFFQYQFNPDHSMLDHITAVENIAMQLKDLGASTCEPEIITKILCTISHSYGPLITAWDSMGESKKTVSLLTARLIKGESRLQKSPLGDQKPETAFYLKKGPPHSRSKLSNGLSDKPLCQFCRKRGHKATYKEQDCFRKEAYEEGLKDARHTAAIALAPTSASVTDTDIA